MYDFSPKDLTKNSTSLNSIKASGTDSCLVLQYHRVGLFCHDPLQLAVEVYNFESQMEYLAENFNVISMNEMKQHLENATAFRDKTVTVTFDGGYADVLYQAKEVLDRYEIPATAFSASVNIIKKGQLWWDELEDILIANRFQGRLELDMEGRSYNWPLESQCDRFRAYDDLYSILCDIPPAEQRAIIEQITQNIGLQAEEHDNHRTMDAQELKQLNEDGLITIGGHTHNCVNLSSLFKWEQIEEISKNKEVLEEVLGHRIEYFSCPFANDYDCAEDTMSILRDIGFSLALGNLHGMVSITGEGNYYELPRVKVGNWKPFVFHKFMKRFFD